MPIGMTQRESESIRLPTRLRPSGHSSTWGGLRYAYVFLAAACWSLGQPNHEHNAIMIEPFRKEHHRSRAAMDTFVHRGSHHGTLCPAKCEAGCKGIEATLGNVTKSADQRIEQFLCVTVTTPISWSSFHLWETTRTWISIITQNPLFGTYMYQFS